MMGNYHNTAITTHPHLLIIVCIPKKCSLSGSITKNKAEKTVTGGERLLIVTFFFILFVLFCVCDTGRNRVEATEGKKRKHQHEID